MSEAPCRHDIALGKLLDYWLGDLPPTEHEEIEARLFSCASCSARLQELVSLGEGLRAIARNGGSTSVFTPRFLERIKAQGAVVREYRIGPGGSVNCSIAP